MIDRSQLLLSSNLYLTVDATSSFTGCVVVPDSTKMFSAEYPTIDNLSGSSLSSV